METVIWTLETMREHCHELAELRKNKYFQGLPSFYGMSGVKAEDFRFVMILGDWGTHPVTGWDENDNPVIYEDQIRPVYGIAELQVSCYNANEVWLKYISVQEAHQGKGYGSLLINKIAECMTHDFAGKTLARSRTAEAAPDFIQAKVSQKLNAAGVPWKQERYVAGQFDAVVVSNIGNPQQL